MGYGLIVAGIGYRVDAQDLDFALLIVISRFCQEDM